MRVVTLGLVLVVWRARVESYLRSHTCARVTATVLRRFGTVDGTRRSHTCDCVSAKTLQQDRKSATHIVFETSTEQQKSIRNDRKET